MSEAYEVTSELPGRPAYLRYAPKIVGDHYHSIIRIILITSRLIDQTVRSLRKYYEILYEISNFVLVLIYVYCMLQHNQTIFKAKTEKPKAEKIRGIQGFTLDFHIVHIYLFLT